MDAMIAVLFLLLAVPVFCLWIDQGIFFRRNTLYRLPDSEREVALTFDDGPDPRWTPTILSILKRRGVKATFFLIGRKVEAHPELARMIVEEGHAVGNHTYAHSFWGWANSKRFMRSIVRAEHAILAATGVRPVLFRPPRGICTAQQKKIILSMGYEVVLWSLSGKDWANSSAARIFNRIARRISPGEIILLHDSGGVFSAEGGDRSATCNALDEIVSVVRDRGYSFSAIRRSGYKRTEACPSVLSQVPAQES